MKGELISLHFIGGVILLRMGDIHSDILSTICGCVAFIGAAILLYRNWREK
jgi:hypothetical protein